MKSDIASRIGVMFEQLGRADSLTVFAMILGFAAVVLAVYLIWTHFFDEGIAGRIGLVSVILAAVSIPLLAYIENVGRDSFERVTVSIGLPGALMFFAAFFLLVRMTYRAKSRKAAYMRERVMMGNGVGGSGGGGSDSRGGMASQ